MRLTCPVFGISTSQFDGVMMEAYVNDVPVLAPIVSNNHVTSQLINDRLKPGRNIVELRIMRMVSNADVPLRFMIYRTHPHDPATDNIVMLEHLEFPRDLADLDLPLVVRKEVTVEEDFHRHALFDAPVQDFGPEGTPELRAAVQRIYDGLVQRNAALLLAMNTLRHKELVKSFPGHPAFAPDALHGAVAGLVNGPLEVAPFDADALIYQPVADGRVAYVRRVDGRDFLRSRRTDEPDRIFQMNKLTLARFDDVWTRI